MLRAMVVCGLLWLVAVFAAAAAEDVATDAPLQVADTRFQAQLSALGIPLRLPAQGKAIIVNIPAFELVAVQDGTPVFRSRVIVGAPYHRTPRITTYTTKVRFRPTWRPTPSMVASGKYRDRIWPPGEKNPLGLAAIRLQPGLLVYLHDTNNRGLFEEEYRALSHGCVRVQAWDTLVAWVLGIRLDDVHRLANGSRTIDYPTDRIPVHLGYYLRFPREDGSIAVYDDLYRLGLQRSGILPGLGRDGASPLSCATAEAE